MRIQDVMRASSVKRWHTVSTIRQQTLAEHSFNVCMLAKQMADMIGMPAQRKALLLEMALVHDLDEVFTGDIPTPAKEQQPINEDWAGDHFLKHIIKLADLIDAFWFIHNWGAGQHAKKVQTDCWNRFTYHLRWTLNSELHSAAEKVMNEVMSGQNYEDGPYVIPEVS